MPFRLWLLINCSTSLKIHSCETWALVLSTVKNFNGSTTISDDSSLHFVRGLPTLHFPVSVSHSRRNEKIRRRTRITNIGKRISSLKRPDGGWARSRMEIADRQAQHRMYINKWTDDMFKAAGFPWMQV